MRDKKLESMWIDNNNNLRNLNLTEFIEREVSDICYNYIETTGKKPPDELIKNIIFMLVNAYEKCELMKHEKNDE